MTGSMQYRLFALMLAACGSPTGLSAMQEEPDTVYRIEPIMVRVLGSTIGMGAPYPVSVIAGPELTRGNSPAFIEDALRAVPGVQVQNRYNLAVGERISIRGFGARSQFGVRGVRVLVDGIPATLPDGQATLDHLDLAGLGRVEALRGPSAAAYGNGAGGVLHFRTLDPSSTPASVSVRTTAGSDGLWTIEGNSTGTSGDTGYRVGVSRMTYDGFRRDPIADDGSVYGGGTRSVFNGTLAFPLAGGTARIVANAVDLDAENPGSLPQSGLDAGERAAWGFNVVSGARKEVRQGQIGATWESTVGSTALEVATWGIRRELFNPIPGRVVDLKRNAGGVRGTIGGGFGMSNGSFQWRAGGEAEIQDDDRKNFDNDGGDPGALILDQDERVRALAFFGQARLDSGDAISILAGFRFDNVGFSVSDRFIGAGEPDDSGSRTMASFNPSIGVVFKPVERVELFGSLSRAFETPTTTELANSRAGSGGFNPFLEPQVSLTVEAGFRGRNSLGSVEASIFSTELTNGLVPFEVETDPGRTYYRNAGRSSYMGWEVSLDGRVTPDASVRIAYTRINAEYVLFRTDDARFDGNRIPGLAPRRIDGVVNYTPGLGFVELRGLWQDRVPVDDANLARASPYFLMDLTVGADAVRFGNVGVSPFIGISNLTDYEYTASVVPNAFGSRYFEPGPGRTYRVGLGVTWGG